MHADTASKIKELRKFMNYLPGKATILDIGAGGGHDAAYLKEKGNHLTTLDNAQIIIRETRQRYPDINAQLGDMTQTKLATESYDGVWCSNTFPHVAKEQQRDAIRECARLLKKRGVLYCNYRLPAKSDKPTILTTTTSTELHRLLENTGFTLLEEYPDAQDARWVHLFARKK